MWDNDTLLRNIANTMLACSVIAVFSGAVYYVMNMPGVFPLRSVRLSVAPQKVAAEQVLRVLHTEVQGNLITVDIDGLRHSLEQIPWVRSVNIRREFPDCLAVQLEEHQALARWNGNKLVNVQGEVFVAESERVMPGASGTPRPPLYGGSERVMPGASGTPRPPLYGGSERVMPSFIGPEGTSDEVTHHYAEFSLQLDALDLHATQLVLSPRHAWQILLSNGMVLELGREDVQQRLARFVAVYPYSLQIEGIRQDKSGAVEYVDLRYRNGFAVRKQRAKGKVQRANLLSQLRYETAGNVAHSVTSRTAYFALASDVTIGATTVESTATTIGLPTGKTTDETTDMTTSHLTNPAKDAGQVIGYSHLTKAASCQVIGYGYSQVAGYGA